MKFNKLRRYSVHSPEKSSTIQSGSGYSTITSYRYRGGGSDTGSTKHGEFWRASSPTLQVKVRWRGLRDFACTNIHQKQITMITRRELLRKRSEVVQQSSIWSQKLDRSRSHGLQKGTLQVSSDHCRWATNMWIHCTSLKPLHVLEKTYIVNVSFIISNYHTSGVVPNNYRTSNGQIFRNTT